MALKVKKGALGKVLGVNQNPGLQPRLNERTITKGIQETNRRDIQGGNDTYPEAQAGKNTQGGYGSYNKGSRLQGGVTGVGTNTQKPLTMKPAAKQGLKPMVAKKFKKFQPLNKI